MKTEHINKYLKEIGIEEDAAYVAMWSDILPQVIDENISELLMTKDQYKTLERLMIYSAQWNWDKKTFMGIRLTIV